MADETPTLTPSAPDGNETPVSAPDGTKEKTKAEFVPRSELEEAASRRDAAAKRARDLEGELKALRLEIEGKGREEATKTGDVAKLKDSFDTELKAKDTQIADLLSKVHNLAVEGEVRKLAVELGAYSADQVWGLMGAQFEARDEGGKLVCGVRDSVVPTREHIKRFLDANPNLAKNSRAPGSGTSGPGDSKAGISIAELNAMSSAQQREAFARDPELARRVAVGMK